LPNGIMSVGERIRKLRKSLGLNQQEFAKRIGIARGYLSELESGKKPAPDRILKLISHTFGVSYEWLKYGKGEMWEKGGEEVPVWLREKLKTMGSKDIELLKELIELIEALNEEEKEFLKMILKKQAEKKKSGS